ncbi:hypothetical protein GQ457_15G018610 [Hibiscus cannabinus]
MRKMDVADATPISVAMPTAPTNPIHTTAADPDESRLSAPAEAQPTPAASPPIFPVPGHTSTPSPTTTPIAMPASRRSTPDSPLGSTPSTPPSPSPAQSEEVVPLHILYAEPTAKNKG